MTREEALQVLKERMDYYEREKRMRAAIEVLVPEFAEKEDDKIIQFFAELATDACGGPGQEYYEEFGLNYDKVMTWLEKKKEQKSLDISAASEWLREHVCSYMNSEYNEFHKCVEYDGSIDKERLINDFEEAMQKEQKPIKMEVYEIGKGTTVCGQDYKCKKDYKTGTCWYIKDAIYHCSRDGYLNDQNGVSWSCTPEWFKEYIQSHTEWAEEEKTRFVSGQFLQCKLSFDGFKEGEHYWLEYIGDDMYVGRSDNILNQKFHITPRQLYTLFSQKLEEVQGPPQEEKQISLNYELPFNENPSDIQIIEALIKHLKEQDGFLTAIDCVSTKSILSWLEKQKEEEGYEAIPVESTLEYKLGFKAGKDSERQKEQKPVEWDFPYGMNETVDKLIAIAECLEMDGDCSFNGYTGTECGKFLRDLARKQVECRPAERLSKEEYVKRFKALCDAYEIKLPNRAYDIYHLCDDLAELFGNTNNQE